MRAAAIYYALLRCYPAPFRDEYGDEMCMTFAEQLNDAHRALVRAEGTPADATS